jgi:hypothetical protein
LYLNIKNLKLLRSYLLLILFSVVFLVYGPLLKKHYALDTYVVEASGNQGEEQIRLGRFLSGMILNFLTKIGVNTAVHQSFLTFFSLCLLAFSIYMLIRLFLGVREEWEMLSFLLLCLASVVSLCNVFILHWFLFPEVVIFMMTGLLLSILAITSPVRYRGISWFISYILLFAAISFYQAVGAFFLIFGMLHISIRRERQLIISALKGFVSIFTVYIAAGVTNILLIKWLGRPTGRTQFEHWNPTRNIYSIVASLQEKLHNTNLGITPILFGIYIALLFLCTVNQPKW